MNSAATQQDLQATAVRPAVHGFSLVGVNDPVRGKVYPLTGKVVIGRDEQCDIIVDSPLVSRRHAEIEITDRGVRVHDLGSSNGTFVAGERITDCLLAPGEEIRLDEVRFLLRCPPEDPASTRLRPAVDPPEIRPDATLEQPVRRENSNPPLLVGRTGSDGERFTLTGRHTTVGRAETNDIVLTDPTVSTHHADLTAENGHWRIADQDSRNGTFVNDHRISGRILANGDVIRFGRVAFLYEHPVATEDLVTSLIAGPEDTTRTSMTPVVQTSRPWLWGIGSFLLVAAAMTIAYLLRQ
jgi:pSer/pThr/pTyr-binding forkhead associated (FHA) protein